MAKKQYTPPRVIDQEKPDETPTVEPVEIKGSPGTYTHEFVVPLATTISHEDKAYPVVDGKVSLPAEGWVFDMVSSGMLIPISNQE